MIFSNYGTISSVSAERPAQTWAQMGQHLRSARHKVFSVVSVVFQIITADKLRLLHHTHTYKEWMETNSCKAAPLLNAQDCQRGLKTDRQPGRARQPQENEKAKICPADKGILLVSPRHQPLYSNYLKWLVFKTTWNSWFGLLQGSICD